MTFGGGFGITFNQISAGDPDHLMVLGDEMDRKYLIRRSTDAGKTWQTVFHDTVHYTDDLGVRTLRKCKLHNMVTPHSRLVIVTCDSGYILRSEDWGETWTGQRLDVDHNFVGISMADSLFGIIYEYPDRLWRTTDGGRNWSGNRIPSSTWPKGFGISQVKAVSSQSWLAVITNYQVNGDWLIARTTDAGRNWSTTGAASSVAEIHMFDQQHGCLVGIGPQLDPTRQHYADVVQLTEDGGHTWVTALDEYIEPAIGLGSVAFADRMNGIAVGPSTKALRTTDGGWTWLSIMEGLDFDEVFSMSDVVYPTPSTAFACAAKGVVYRYDFPSSSTSPAPEVPRVSFHPVPASEDLTVIMEMPAGGDVRVVVSDMLGNYVIGRNIPWADKGSLSVRLDCRSLPCGNYVARVKAGDAIVVRTFKVLR